LADKEKKERRAPKFGALLKAPKNVGSCSHDGEQYQVDDDGLVEVPAAAVAALVEHGFEIV
jgi:hypothetical protein